MSEKCPHCDRSFVDNDDPSLASVHLANHVAAYHPKLQLLRRGRLTDYNLNDPEEYEAVSEWIRKPWPRTQKGPRQ